MITPFQILTFCIYFGSIVLAIYFGVSIAQDGLNSFIWIVGVIGGLAWLGFGSSIWWLPLFFGIGLGGEFYFGFKILSHEAGILIGILALLPTALLRRGTAFPHRKKLPVLVWIFLAYLGGHCLWSIYQYAHGDMISVGSVGRYYFSAGWPLFFLALFHYNGASRHLIWALYALEIAYFLRTVIGIVFFFFPSFAYLPGINFVLPGAGVEGLDLRIAGAGLGAVALALLFDKNWFPMKPVQMLMVLLAIAALLMGGGRGPFLSFVAVLMFATIYSRNWILGAGIPLGFLCLVYLVNQNPALIDSLPANARRTASIMILKEVHGMAQDETASSDAFHRKLSTLGLQRWTENTRSFLLGTGVKPYDWTIMKETDLNQFWELQIEAAADSGIYEVGLWRIVTIMGLIALLFYLGLFVFFAMQVASLSKAAKEDRFGRVFSFLAYALPFQWLCTFTLTGDFPSYELLMAGLAYIYLQDRAWEEEMRKQNPLPTSAFPMPV